MLRHGVLTCSGAPQASLRGSWRLLGALAAPQVTIHRPCRCLGGSQVTICRACRCLEAFGHALKFRSIVPGGVWKPLGWLLDVFGSSTSFAWRLMGALGVCKIKIHRPSWCPRSYQGAPRSSPRHDPSALSVSQELPGSSWKHPKTRSICPVGVWKAHKSRPVVPVGVWRPPGMLGSHDLSCLSVFASLPGCSGMAS